MAALPAQQIEGESMTTEEHERRLAPCPFCGGEAYLRTREDESLFNHNIVSWTIVGCRSCNFDFETCEDVEPDAVTAWNCRAATAPQGDAGEGADLDAVDRAAIEVANLLHAKAGGREVTPHDIARAVLATQPQHVAEMVTLKERAAYYQDRALKAEFALTQREQAARAAERERCAKAAGGHAAFWEREASNFEPHSETWSTCRARMMVATDIAAAIRNPGQVEKK
jgi:hypothetical protein